MISQREVQKNYQKLMIDVQTDDYYKTDLASKVNCYSCTNCGHVTKTKDVDAGCTPMVIKCESCKAGNARSHFYEDVAPEKEVTQEWYRPSLQETLKLRGKKSQLLEHVLNGGLLLRKIKQ